jgi:hypothetical protein
MVSTTNALAPVGDKNISVHHFPGQRGTVKHWGLACQKGIQLGLQARSFIVRYHTTFNQSLADIGCDLFWGELAGPGSNSGQNMLYVFIQGPFSG